MRQQFAPWVALSAYQFFYFSFIGIFTPYFPLYLDSLGWSAASIAALMATMQAARIISPPLCSWWVGGDARRARRVVVLAPWAALLGFLPFYVSQTVGIALASVAAAAFFWSAALPLLEAITLSALGHEVRRYPWIRVWGSIGFITVVVNVGAWLERATVATVREWVVASLIALGIVGFWVPEPVRWPRPDTGNAPFCWWRVRPIVIFFAATFAMATAHGALYAFYSLHLAALGYGKAAIGALWALGVVAEIFLFLGLPRLMGRVGVWPLFVASFAVASMRFLLIAWGAEGWVVAVAAQLLHAVTFGVYHGTAVQLINSWFGRRAPAVGQAIYSSVSFGFGGMMGAAMAGWSWEVGGGTVSFTVAAFVAAMGGILAELARRFAVSSRGVE
ncbi:MAG: MFS transporter [Hydrogenophilus sp.]|nr:MFS transporter [Hydrogenophilus sp.]